MPSTAPETTDQLIAALILEAGRHAEDAIPSFVRAWTEITTDQEERINELYELAISLTALSTAVIALHRGRVKNCA